MLRPIAATLLCASAVGAQSLSDVPTFWDMTVGVGNAMTVSGAASRATYLGSGDRYRIGLTGRATYVSGNLALGPVDPRLPREATDSMEVSASSVLLNVGMNFSADINERWIAGMNLDLFGFSVGAEQIASYRSTPNSAARSVNVTPGSPNIFGGGSGDKGSLNSEFYAMWTLNERYALRGGVSHQLTEYKSDLPLDSNAKRYRRYDNLVFIGLRITSALR
jgi:hypothetical protein